MGRFKTEEARMLKRQLKRDIIKREAQRQWDEEAKKKIMATGLNDNKSQRAITPRKIG